MEKVRYMISDAADMVHVETHVLRYWEEELGLSIPRNEMGHRYYTRENIKEFQKIKELKEQGYQLKAIRMILHTGNLPEQTTGEWYVNTMDEEPIIKKVEYAPTNLPVQHMVSSTQKSLEEPAALTPEERMAQFRELMSDIVGQAVAQNNEALSEQIGKDVQESVLKEMNYLMREQDEAQEERYRKLDAAIRGSIRKKSIFTKNKKERAEKA